MDKSVFDVILNICKKTDIPPMPSKNEVNTILIDMNFMCILEIIDIPFVISKSPIRSEEANAKGICNNLKIGDTKIVKTLNK